MALVKKIKTNFEHADERGSLVQLVRGGYSQINVVSSKAGTFRGGHYHKLNTEAYYIISGRCNVTAKKDDIEENYSFSEGDFFMIGPYVVHEYDYQEDTIQVSMYSLGVEIDINEKDIYEQNNK